MQMLHNLNKDDLAGFEEAWKGKARKHLPGSNQGFDMLGNEVAATGRSGRRQDRHFPSMELPWSQERVRSHGDAKHNR
ncbi:uncharacterized protein LOC143877386 isoform X3 [Tasmannia lanceolata]